MSDYKTSDEQRFKLVINYLLEGQIIDYEGYRYGMDENNDVGFIAKKENGIDCVMGDRLTFGQVYRLAQKMPEVDIVSMAAVKAIKGK